MGLLKAERSTSNYRYYCHKDIELLRYIEKRKATGLSLDDIRREIIEKQSEEIDVQELRIKMQDLEKDVTQLLKNMDINDPNNQQYLKKNVSHESLALIQSLLLLLN